MAPADESGPPPSWNRSWTLKDAKAKFRRDRFIETARELDCDEDENRFDETLERVLKQPVNSTRSAQPDDDG